MIKWYVAAAPLWFLGLLTVYIGVWSFFITAQDKRAKYFPNMKTDSEAYLASICYTFVGAMILVAAAWVTP